MRYGVFLERLALRTVAMGRVERLRAAPGIEHDAPIAFASRRVFRAGKQTRSDPFPPSTFGDRHLAELDGSLSSGLSETEPTTAPWTVAQKCRRSASSARSSSVSESPSGWRKVASRKVSAWQ